MTEWETTFQHLRTEWELAARPIRTVDQSAFVAMAAEAGAIRAAGRWLSGPSDLMSLLGRNRDELLHSRMLGWLLTPTGRHQLGDRFLTLFLAAIGVETSRAASSVIRVDLEVTCSGASLESGEALEARADIVLKLDDLVVVIENKLDAGEQDRQCERLYWAWANDPTEVRWVFLTPSGRPPATATGSSVAAWISLSYRTITTMLGRALEDAPASRELGRLSAQQYHATLLHQNRQ